MNVNNARKPKSYILASLAGVSTRAASREGKICVDRGYFHPQATLLSVKIARPKDKVTVLMESWAMHVTYFHPGQYFHRLRSGTVLNWLGVCPEFHAAVALHR